MTITIPPVLQYPIAPNGYDSLVFDGCIQKQSASATITTSASLLSISGDVVYTDGVMEVGKTLVPPMRPAPSAAMHVVGKSFLDTFFGLTEGRIRRFL
jgi:hypothetical protein